MGHILAHLTKKKKSCCYSGEKSFNHSALSLQVSNVLVSTCLLIVSARHLFYLKIQGSHSLSCLYLAFPQPLNFGHSVDVVVQKYHRFLILRLTALWRLWADGKLARTVLKAAFRRNQTLY